MKQNHNKTNASIYVGNLRIGIVCDIDNRSIRFDHLLPQNCSELDKFEFLGLLKALDVLRKWWEILIEVYEDNPDHEVSFESDHLSGEQFGVKIRFIGDWYD